MAGVAKETPEVVETADGDEPADTELQTPPSTWVLLRLGRFKLDGVPQQPSYAQARVPAASPALLTRS